MKHSGLGVDDALLERRVLELQSHALWSSGMWMPRPRWRACGADATDPFHEDVPRYDAILTYGGGP